MIGAGLSTRQRKLLFDGGLAIAGILLLALPLGFVDGSARMWAAAGWSALMVSSIALRRAAPYAAVAVCAAAGVGMLLQLAAPAPAIVTVPVIVYSAARALPGRRAMLVVPVWVAASFAGPISWLGAVTQGRGFVTGSLLVLLCLAICAVAHLLGLRVRDKTRLDLLERELAEQRFAAGSETHEKSSALAAERIRSEVAHELHDVVAHSLSVIVVQAEGAKALMARQPEAAREALDVIARTGRSSISEMRHIVALLSGGDATLSPAPGLGDIADMVAKAGDRVTLEGPGEWPAVPDSLGLTAFRVVQESVTNFLKHAGPTARAAVEVRCNSDEIVITVTDDGIGAQARGDGRGTGLRGMRERVSAMNGTLTAGPRAGGGYAVTATLPLPARLGRGWMK